MSESVIEDLDQPKYDFTDAISCLKTAAWEIEDALGYVAHNEMEDEFMALTDALRAVKFAMGGIEVANIRLEEMCDECAEEAMNGDPDTDEKKSSN